jgi:nucleoside-diphosphate-sugar epimerase
MKILIVGATGVLGRATLPHLRDHDVVGTTRSESKRDVVTTLGARAEIADVYAPGAVARVARAFAPDVVVNFLTDLAGGPGPANSRIRATGGPVVVEAAVAAGARRLVVESIAFETSTASAAAVAALEALEAGARASGLEAVVLRFGRLWGPGTWDDTAPAPPSIHIAEAGRRAAQLLVSAAPGDHVVADS